MKNRPVWSAQTVAGGCLLSAVLGWFLYGFVMPDDDGLAASGNRGAFQAVAAAGGHADPGKKRPAKGGFSQFVDLAARLSDDPGAKLPANYSLATQEAEQLARMIRGEALAAAAEHDPAGILAEIARGDYYQRQAALKAWSARDPEGAFHAVLACKQISDYDARLVVAGMVRHDLAKTKALLELAGPPAMDGSRLDQAWAQVFAVWAQDDLSGLQNQLPTLESRSGTAAEAVAAVMTKTDPATALAWAQSLPDKTIAAGAVRRIVDELYQSNPSLAAEYALHLENYNNCYGVGSAWSERDPEEALRWVKEHPDSSVSEGISYYYLRKIAETDVAKVRAYWDELSPARQLTAFPDIAEALARNDPALALQWAASLPENLREGALCKAAWECRDAAVSAQFARALPQYAPAILSRYDPAGAARAMASLTPEGQERALAYMELMGREVYSTSAVIVDALPEGPVRSAAVAGVAARWASEDPVAASAWVETLPDDASRTGAAQNLVANWVRYDGESAHRWVNSLTPGPVKEAAAKTLTDTEAKVAGQRTAPGP